MSSSMRFVLFTVVLLGLTWPMSCAAQDDSGLRLRLTYQLPKIDTDIRLDATRDIPGTSFTAEETLQATTDIFLPGFELDFKSGGYGRYVLEYFEFRLRGADFIREPIFFDGLFYPQAVPVRSKYEFRTVNLNVLLGFPIDDYLNLDFILSARFVQFFTSLTAPTAFQAADDTTTTILPTIGVAGELFIIDQLYLYGSFQILGYSIDGRKESKLLFLDDDSNVFTRDWRIGIRFEIVTFASILFEYRSLTLRVKKGKARYRQDVEGFAFGIEIKLF